ncbi:hypothetical protein AX16_000898 [Volvariella volvacea WC 439]|nr:hypothetical protein AX16_000898 [Volvariella volvacea WC 439]
MNSYPPELLAQLAPLMFVAGLNSPNPPGHHPNTSIPLPSPVQAQSPTTPTQPTPTPRTQDPFTVLILRLREALVAQRKAAIWQPEKTKTFQVVLVDKEVQFPPRKISPTEDIHNYTHHTNNSPFSGVYATGTGGNVQHSPLSPLTPSSPLYPDGLIAPIWIRKHTTLVPSVFVLFLRIYEHPPHRPKSPLDPPDLDWEKEREQEERKRDTELASEIALRKRSTNERSIKLTVVLMASRRMLDDPTLDTRLTYIRRQSGLDSRAALFVLSPVSPSELSDFVQSLQQALYEPALDYYTFHSKRVRRKRNRHSQATYAVPPSPLASANTARPLRSEGWTVRYEYKMACFAEFRGEDEVALKHYQDAYAMLLLMFGSTAILPPRTKRWAEAKVLADCINIKIVKLYLYNNEHALALFQHNSHMRKFSDFSRGWGIGEETFEFWSWLARQHKVLAELLEQGTRSTLKLPVHKPIPPSVMAQSLLSSSQIQVPSQRAANPLEIDAVKQLGINPYHALQHPGFYYYMAAKSTEMRRSRFMNILEVEMTRGESTGSPGFVNEKKVDHLVIILELYTKAYELFKKYASVNSANPTQGRLTLWIAYRIAQTYYDSGKFDTAIKFFERIARTYRREKWDDLLRPLLETWYRCAQQLGDVDLSIRLLVELLGHDVADSSGPSALEEDLLAVMQSTVPSSPDTPLLVDLSESIPVFNTTVNFWSSDIKVHEAVAFQITLEAPKVVDISHLPFKSISIYFEDETPPFIVKHRPAGDVGDETDNATNLKGNVRIVKLGTIPDKHLNPVSSTSSEEQGEEVEATLRWLPGDVMLLTGVIVPSAPGILRVIKAVLTISEAGWNVEVPCDPRAYRQEHIPRWLCSMNPPKFMMRDKNYGSTAVVRHRPHRIRVAVSHQTPAYLNEEFPILLDITNDDEQELEVILDVLLQPTEIDEAINSISLDGEQSTSLIRGISCGRLAPGMSIMKSLYLMNTGAGGDRIIDISVHSKPAVIRPPTPPLPHEDVDLGGNESSEQNNEEHNQEDEKTPRVAQFEGQIPHSEPEYEELNVTETLRTLVIPTVEPIKYSREVVYRHSLNEWVGIGDLRTFDGDFWDDRVGGEAIVRVNLGFEGPWEVEVKSIELIKEDNDYAKIIESSLDRYASAKEGEGVDDSFPEIFSPGDTHSEHCVISIASPEEGDNTAQPGPIHGPGHYQVAWRRIFRNGERGTLSITRIFLPPLNPPSEGLVGLLKVPPIGKLHSPLPLELTIRNYHPSRSANIIVYLEPDHTDASATTAPTAGSSAPSPTPGTPASVPSTPIASTHPTLASGGPSATSHSPNSFLVAGLRSGRIPILLPLTEHVVKWNLIPLECGYCKLPIIRVLDARNNTGATVQTVPGGGGDVVKGSSVSGPGQIGGAPGTGTTPGTGAGSLASLGEAVKIVDVRMDVRKVETDETSFGSGTLRPGGEIGDETSAVSGVLGTVLILP